MKEATKLERTKKWFENQTFFVVLAIFLVGYLTISQCIKVSKENLEILHPISNQETTKDTSETEGVFITGKVYSNDNYPINNVKVQLTGVISNGSYTDSEGSYGIFVPSKMLSNVLEFHYSKERYKPYIRKLRLDRNSLNNNLERVILENISIQNTKKRAMKIISADDQKSISDKTEINNSGTIGILNTGDGNIINLEKQKLEIQKLKRND